MAVEPVAHLIAEELALLNDRRWQAQLRELPDPMLARRYDVASLAAESGFQGSAFILYGTQHRNEHEEAVPLGVLHAYWLARHERMTLCPFFDHPGNLWEALIRGSEAMEVLRRYLFGEPTSPASQPLALSATSQQRSGRGLAHYHFDVTLLAVDEAEAEAGPARAEEIPDRYAAVGKLEAPPVRGVDNGWRSWIAENLMLGASPNTMEATMAARGIPHEQAAAEIRDALQSPYFWGAQRLCNRLKKRDWQLATYRKLQRLRPGSNRLERRSRLSREEFLKAHESTGRPVIMSGMFEVGDASSRWTFEELLRRHGGCMVALEVDSTQGEDGHPVGMTLLGHVERMRGAAPGQNYVLKLLDGPHNHPILEEFSHRLGSIPEFVADSPVLEQTLLLGERGSISPFRDLVKDQYLAQVIGHIRVRIVPSWDSPLMKNTHDQASELDGRMAPESGLSPALDQPQILNAVLNPGDFLFLPAGTWLFVEAREAFAAVSMSRSGVGDDLASRFPRERKM
ncbi:cupin-like domain-containing protein [Singulisphaera sp. PoT]|uniref:cupin-like domain-containing protein n=1 Tax=Singulisphaera sp. PoT TaxID=3411797 RepID=UPI003BF5D57B